MVPIYLLIAVFGGIWVSKQALSPLTKFSKIAREIGILSVTISEMLDKIESTIEKEKQFTSDASHELKTPIAVISAHVENAMSYSTNHPELDYSRDYS